MEVEDYLLVSGTTNCSGEDFFTQTLITLVVRTRRQMQNTLKTNCGKKEKNIHKDINLLPRAEEV